MSMEHGDGNSEKIFDIAIIGAGPVGIELAVCLRRAGIDYIHIDANQIGHTLTWWPRNTNFFSTTERIEIAGIPLQNTHQQRTTGEDYLVYLRGIVEQYDLQVNTYERVTDLQRCGDEWTLTTNRRGATIRYHTRRVVVAIGDMEYPNRIGIPGDDLPHVTHYFRDPHDYFRQRLLIVGGRNSAVEAALRCWRAGAQVTVSYRRAELDATSVKHWLLPDFNAQVDAGTIRFLPETVPLAITPTHVVLAPTTGNVCEQFEHPADFVFMATGFYGDQSLLEQAGVQFEGPNRVPVYDPTTMETNAAGVYLAGTVAAGVQQSYSLFIENSHEHVGKIVEAITGRWPDRIGAVAARTYSLPLHDIIAN